MTVARSVAEVLTDRVSLEIESIDRMYLNAYVPGLQYVGGVASFFQAHRGYPFASSALMDPISKDFIASLHRMCRDLDAPMIDFEKGQRKDDIALGYLAEFTGEEGVLFVGKAQEKTRVFRTEKRRNPDTGATYPWIVTGTGMVNHYYVYAVSDFGPYADRPAMPNASRDALRSPALAQVGPPRFRRLIGRHEIDRDGLRVAIDAPMSSTTSKADSPLTLWHRHCHGSTLARRQRRGLMECGVGLGRHSPLCTSP